MAATTTSAQSPGSRPVALQTIVGLTRQSTRANLAALWFTRGTLSATIMESDGVYAPDERGVSALGEALRRLCENDPNGLLLSNVDTDPRLQAADGCPGAKSVAAMPIWTAGGLTGVLAVVSDAPGAFSELDAATLHIVAIWLGASFDGLVEQWAKDNADGSEISERAAAVIPRSAPPSVLHPERHLAAALAMAGMTPERPAGALEVATANPSPNMGASSATNASADDSATLPAAIDMPPLQSPSTPHSAPAVVVMPRRPSSRGVVQPTAAVPNRKRPKPEPGIPEGRAAASTAAESVRLQTKASEAARQPRPAAPTSAAPSVGNERSDGRPRANTTAAFGPETILGRWEKSTQKKPRGLKLMAATMLATVAVAASGWFLYVSLVGSSGMPKRASEPSAVQPPVIAHPTVLPAAIAATPGESEPVPLETRVAAPNARAARGRSNAMRGSNTRLPVPVRQTLQLAPSRETEVSDTGPPELSVAGEKRVPALAPVTAAIPVPAPRIAHGVPAELISQVAPLYPPQARPMRVEGSVVLYVQITDEGKVDGVQVVSGPSVFRENAIAAVKKWRYKPAQLDGKAVESSAEIILRFSAH